MPPAEVVPTPGVDRVITFTINGGAFAFRRPSRGDQVEAARRTAMKLTLAIGESEALNRIDGFNLQWDAQLEIGLRPRKTRDGKELSLGECAPAHWLETVRDAAGTAIGQVISFDNVDPAEYAAVVDHLTTALAPAPNPGAPAGSTTTAPGPINA